MTMYMDGGKGMITKIIGRKCIEYNQYIINITYVIFIKK